MSRVVVITGATRGIGAAIARAFAREGAALILTGRNRPSELTALEGAASVEVVPVDFTDREATASFCDDLAARDRVDVCINNAGINIIKPIESVTTDDFEAVTDVNYRAPYLISRAAAIAMKRNGGGHIVNIASIWSVVTRAERTLYTAAKTGLVGMTRALAVELASAKILVNAVSPGFVMTDLTRASLDSDTADQLAATVPLGRFAEPDEIAKAVAFLASTDNTYLTGQNIVIDGGFTVV